jgi:hypothetical protein
MSIFIAHWHGLYYRFTGGDEARSCTWSAQDLRDAFAEVSDLSPDALPVAVLMIPGCTVQDLFDDADDAFLLHSAAVMEALGAPEWCRKYAEDEVNLMHDTGVKGSYTLYLRGSPRLDVWTTFQVMDFLATMHIGPRWTPSRSDLTALLWHMETMDTRQRVMYQPVINAAVSEVLSLNYESMTSAPMQAITASCLRDIEALGLLDRTLAMKAYNTHAITACIEECGDIVVHQGNADLHGPGRWDVLSGFRAYMKDHFWMPSLWALIHEDGNVTRLVQGYMGRHCTTLYGCDPQIVAQRTRLRDDWIDAVKLQFHSMHASLDVHLLLPFLQW